jgi:hypothetical protein
VVEIDTATRAEGEALRPGSEIAIEGRSIVVLSASE